MTMEKCTFYESVGFIGFGNYVVQMKKGVRSLTNTEAFIMSNRKGKVGRRVEERGEVLDEPKE